MMRILTMAWSAMLLSLAAPVTAQAQWANASDGWVPPGATRAGHEGPEHGRVPFYVCRADHRGALHIGKLRPEFGGCNIGWGGRELTIRNYQVYVHALYWRQARGGEVPPGAIPSGRETDGRPFYICRAMHNDGLHVGKLLPAFRGCNIGWGGREVTLTNYEVAVGN